MHKLVLIRHGESIWDVEDRFTGWTDVDLTPTGQEQAKSAGRLLTRVMPFCNKALAMARRMNKRVLVAAHSHSIRALVKHLDEMSDNDIVGLNIPNGIPLVFELDATLKPIRHYYLDNTDAAAQAAAAVTTHGKA